MCKNNNLLLTGKIMWISPKRKGMDEAIANNIFRALTRFPWDCSAEYTGTVLSYSQDSVDGFHDALLTIPFAEPEELNRLIRKSDFFLFEGDRVIAVCRNVKIKNRDEEPQGVTG